MHVNWCLASPADQDILPLAGLNLAPHQSMSDANESGPSACHASAFQHVVCKCGKETMRDRLLMSSHRASFPALLALLAD